MERLVHAVALASRLGLEGRCKVAGEPCSEEVETLWSPSPSYVESGRMGPIRLKEIEWIEWLTAVQMARGRLLPPILQDKGDEFCAALEKAGVPHERCERWVRVLASTLHAPEPLGLEGRQP